MRFRSTTILASLALALSAPAAAVAASPWTTEPYDDTFSGSFEDCGFTIEFEAHVSGLFKFREVEGSDGEAFLGHDNFEYTVVYTNPENGAWFLNRGNALFQEFTARQVEGNLWEFTSQEVGQPFVIEDSAGEVVLRDTGRITRRTVIDTLGDGEPGGEFVEEEITGVSGPHPGLVADFCELATDLIG